MRRKFKKDAGFTLIELMMVLLIIAVTTKIVAVSFEDIGYTARYEQTKERLESIRQAILGNPKQIINGQQAVSGFVADMGRLPYTLRELIEDYDCDGPLIDGNGDTDFNNDGVCPWSIDPTYNTGLGSGWRGPYLTVSNNPTSLDALTDGWGRTTDNLFYGWRYEQGLNPAMLGDANPANDQTDPNGIVRLAVQSLGRDQIANNTLPTNDYIDDFPPNILQNDALVYYPNPLIDKGDWLVDISGGISANFIKSTRAIPNISFCTDATKTTKAACIPPETWYGGCDKTTYFNKTSCTNAAGTWVTCSDGTSATKPLCELAGKNWYGEGFGCSDQSKPNKLSCIPSPPQVWRSCTDNGTIILQNACSAANEIWYGDDLFSISTIPIQPIPPTIPICMKVFYRKSDSTIGVLVSDENNATVINDPKLITADGSFQTIRFTDLRDSSSNLLVTDIPIGSNAIGIYQYNGIGCDTSNILYPINHLNPIQVDFHPHTTLPVINW